MNKVEHTKEWHLQRVTRNQERVNITFGTMRVEAVGALSESLTQAAAAGASLEEIKAARAAA